MKVSDLIKLLAQYPPDMIVCHMGHFGDPHPVDEYDFSEATAYYPPIASTGWPLHTTKQVAPYKVLAIAMPDIGPEPD